MKANQKRTCEWCFNEADLPVMYIPECPILEDMEKKLIMIDKHFEIGQLTEWEEWEITCYDELVKSIRKGNVCTKCWEADQKLYDRYYHKGEDGLMMF